MNNTTNSIIDEAYNKFHDHFIGHDDIPTKDWFINEVKNNPEFAKKWGLDNEQKITIIKSFNV